MVAGRPGPPDLYDPSKPLVVSQGGGLIDLPLRAASHSHTSFSRVAWSIRECARPTKVVWFLNFPRGSRQIVLHCAHRTSTATSCAFCEQEERSACSLAWS